MITRTIDDGLVALYRCGSTLPAMAACYRIGTPERAALDDLLAALRRTDAVLFDRRANQPHIEALKGGEPIGAVQKERPSEFETGPNQGVG